MHKTEAEKILVNILETLGLQDNRTQSVINLMYTLGFSFKEASECVDASIKQLEEVNTVRQKEAFAEWWTAKLRKSEPLDIAFGMWTESMAAQNHLQIQLDQAVEQQKITEKWVDRLANQISVVTDTNIGTWSEGGNPWSKAFDALKEHQQALLTPPETLPDTATHVAYLYIRPDNSYGVTTNLDTARDNAGFAGSVFRLYKADHKSIVTAGQEPYAWYAFQREVSYLVLTYFSGTERYPNVTRWMPLYLEPEAHDFCTKLKIR